MIQNAGHLALSVVFLSFYAECQRPHRRAPRPVRGLASALTLTPRLLSSLADALTLPPPLLCRPSPPSRTAIDHRTGRPPTILAIGTGVAIRNPPIGNFSEKLKVI